MPIRKSIEDTFVVDGPRAEWLDRCRLALEQAGFKNVDANPVTFEVRAAYRKLTVSGEILVTLTPEGETATRATARATAAVDNMFALVKSPGRKILDVFKGELQAPARL